MPFVSNEAGGLGRRVVRSRLVWAGALLVGLTAWVSFASRAAADRLPPDPVEALRQAVLQRQKDLLKKAEAVKSLGDLSRALLVPDWHTDVPQESDAMDAIALRFQDDAAAVLKNGTALEKTAAAYLIGETAAAGRKLEGNVGPRSIYLHQKMASLGPSLVQLSRDPSPRVRAAAAAALGRIEPEPAAAAGNVGSKAADLHEVVAALAKLLDDEYLAPRREAARGLLSLVTVAAQQEKNSRSRQVYPAIRNELVTTAAEVIAPAAKGLKASQPLEVRRAASETIRQVTSALVDLVPGGGDTAGILGRLRLPGPAPGRMLEPALPGKDEFSAVLTAIFDNIKGLDAGSNDADPGIRAQIRRAIEDLAVVRQRLLQRPELPTREEGVRRKNVPILRPVVYAPEATTPNTASPPLQRALQASIVTLVQGLSDPNVEGRLAALDALETMEETTALMPAEQGRAAERGPLAVAALPAIAERTRDRNHFVRWAAARTLGRLAPARPDLVIPAVQVLLRDVDLDLRIVAANTLTRYGPLAAPAVTDLARSARTGDPDIRIAAMKALESIGTAAEPALPALVEDLTYLNAQARAAAARTLARFGSAATFAIPALRKALADSDPDVRKAASEALLTIEKK